MNQPLTHPAQIPANVLLDILTARRIGAEYQPIKHAQSLETMGHEALARFYDMTGYPLSPQQVFATLHNSPITLLHAEQISKQWQVDHAPQAGRLFLNLDPDAFTGFEGHDGTHPALALLPADREVVVEIIENASVQEADRSLALAQLFAGHGIRCALDDIGGPGTLLSLPVLSVVDIFKFDRHWLKSIRQQASARRMLEMLIRYAKAEHKQTVLEGVETLDDLHLARELEVDFVQGYLFKEEFLLIKA